MIRIGDTIYRFDVNRRKYAKPPRGSGRISGEIIYAYHFEPWKVIAETPQSWKCRQIWDDGSTGNQIATVNKKTMMEAGRGGFLGYRYYSESEKYQRLWLHANKPAIIRAFEQNDEFTAFASIAKILNVKTITDVE